MQFGIKPHPRLGTTKAYSMNMHVHTPGIALALRHGENVVTATVCGTTCMAAERSEGGDRLNSPPRDLGCIMLGVQRAAASHKPDTA